MIRVIQRRLIIPRGDTGTFTVPALSPGQAGSVGVFTIFDPITKTRIFQKQVELEGNVFNIEFGHGDTVNLQAGDYLWDIKFYKNPIFADNKVIDGEEIDSYYAAFQTPKCEIRETGDAFMSIEGAHADIEDINLILAATQAANAAKDAATEQAGIAADKAEEAAARLAEMIAAIPTKVSELENDSGYLSQETDPTVPAWAKAQTKPSYTPQEVGALPDNTFIPSRVSDLVDDSGHYTKPASGIPASDLEETYVKFNDYASSSTPGVVKVTNGNYGLYTTNGTIMLQPAPAVMIKTPQVFAAASYDPIVPSTQHQATFYGLATAAGDTTQAQSSNAVGTYTSQAKTAIQTMLDVPAKADIPTNVSELTNDAGYLTEHQDISGKANSADLATVATSGDYDDLINKPTIPEVPVQDVQVNGASVLDANGVANIPTASGFVAGVMKVGAGLGVDGSFVTIYKASNKQIKNGAGEYAPIVAAVQDRSAFYGLAKAAGDTTQSQSDNAVGAYTDSAKAAIQNMLGVPAASAIPTLVSQLTNDSGYLTSFTETDPTVPSWAKAAQKPTYTAAEVGAPTVQEMNTAIGNAIGNINSFDMAVVQALPTEDISTHTIYLVPKTGETNDVYDEYVYINGNWEMVGNTQVDLSNYVQKTDYATSLEAGVVKVYTSGGAYGVYLDSYKTLKIWPSRSTDIKSPSNSNFAPIIPATQHYAAFYGLAKAAGDTTQSQSDNAVGTYTSEAKAAIKTMLGVTDPNVSDVQVNGTSIVQNGIANIQKASSSNLGVVGIELQSGVVITSSGKLEINPASTADIKKGEHTNKPIVPFKQGDSVFYGLATAAGDDTQSTSSNAVGTYTSEAKSAIRTMLGTAGENIIAVQDTQPTESDTKLWIRETSSESVQVPTVAEMNTALAGKVDDVQVNGTSVVQNGVANVPLANVTTFGVVKVNSAYGVDIDSNGLLLTAQAQDNNVKNGNNSYKPITTSKQHMSVFYGLAKAAGDTTQSQSSNAVGTYTAEAKAAIQSMLGIDLSSIAAEVEIPLVETVSGTTPSITGQPNTRYVCGEVSTLSITPPSAGSIDVIFDSGSTPAVITVPNTVRWPAWFDATALEADTTYEILITDGVYGSVMTWAN